MKLKTYRAPTMADALAAVKKDLGKDAVILHTRTLKTGGILGFFARPAVEITASAAAAVSNPARRPLAPPAPAAHEPDLAALLASTAGAAYRRAAGVAPITPQFSMPPAAPAPQPPLQPSPAAQQPARSDSDPDAVRMTVRQRRASEPAAIAAAPAPAPEPVAAHQPARQPAPSAPSSDVARELAEIKLLVNQVLQSTPAAATASSAGHAAMPEALFQHYLKLLESSVSRDIADRVVGAVRDELTPAELADESIVRQTVLRHLAGLVPSADGPVRQPARGRPLTIALVGPTGVGKTTTIAKLAAAYKLRHNKSVGLITTDTYRIAAVDQLRTYAGIIGLPLKVVLTPQEMTGAIESLSDHDVILIDTAGRSQNASERLAELGAFLAAADPHETHLVLSSAASEAVLFKTAEAFAPARPNRVILTKLDEAVNFGVLVNVLDRLSSDLSLRLSFVTTGQEVPDHIEPGRSDRFARMVLDNALPNAAPASAPAGAPVGSHA
jgi:flagellar biosynthesis protein FlhF